MLAVTHSAIIKWKCFAKSIEIVGKPIRSPFKANQQLLISSDVVLEEGEKGSRHAQNGWLAPQLN